jgi:hypothetical protein
MLLLLGFDDYVETLPEAQNIRRLKGDRQRSDENAAVK